MNNYTDKYGRYHDKPCIDGEPSSGNGFIYTSYAKKLGFFINLDHEHTEHCSMFLVRHQHKITSPISRDEILGLAYLGYYPNMNGWNFSPYALPKFNLIKLIKQLWQIRNEHRNYFWENGLSQVFHVAFMVPFHDRDAILRYSGAIRNPLYRFIAWIDSKIKPKSDSGALIRWLKYDIMPDVEVFERYFGSDHPFTIARSSK